MSELRKQQKHRTARKALAHAAVWSMVSAGAGAQTAALEGAGAPEPRANTSLAPEWAPAQQAGAPTPEPTTTSATHTFDLPPGELLPMLRRYEQITGIHVHATIPDEQLGGFRSGGVRGTMSDADALTGLLGRTGLSFNFENPYRVSISIRSAERVEVTGSVPQVGLQQFTEPLLDTAQSVNVVPEYILQEQQDTTMRDALRNVPGISLAAGEGGSQGDNFTIRGFSARNDIFLDGIRDFGSYYRDAFNYDAVDVLEGPAGVEFGRGSTGGVVNQETKLPGQHEHVSAHLQLGTDVMRRGTVDVNEPFEALGGSAFRVNAVGEESNVAGRDFTNVRRFGIAPALAMGLGTHTRGYLTYLHESENDLPDYGLPYFGAGVLPVRRNNFYGYAESNFFRTNPDIVTGRVEHDFGLHLTARNALRFANYPRDVNITEPQINTVPVYSTVTTGGVSSVVATCSPTATTPCYPLTTPLAQLTVRRNQIPVKSTEDMLWDQAGASGHVRFGPVANNFDVIVEGGRERSRPQRTTYPSNIYTSALNPTPLDLIPAATALGVKTYVNSQSYGFGFNDSLRLSRYLVLSGGIRFDYFNTDYMSGTTHLSRLDKQPTYRAAVVGKPRPNGSVYFDYGTSFNPSAESLSLSANNALQAPQYNETYEAGVKWAFLHDRLNVAGALFQTAKTNVYETDPNNSLNVIPVGNQRVRGVQTGVTAHLPQQFDLILGYAFLSGVTTNTEQNYSPFAAFYKAGDPVFGAYPYYLSARGNPFANVPKNTANLFVTHRIAWGFVGGFGFNEVSARRASSTGPVALPQTSAATPVGQLPLQFKVIPGYWALNAMVRRPISDRVAFQANINNLTNAFFVDQPHPNHLIPSEAINAQFGFNYSF